MFIFFFMLDVCIKCSAFSGKCCLGQYCQRRTWVFFSHSLTFCLFSIICIKSNWYFTCIKCLKQVPLVNGNGILLIATNRSHDGLWCCFNFFVKLSSTQAALKNKVACLGYLYDLTLAIFLNYLSTHKCCNCCILSAAVQWNPFWH